MDKIELLSLREYAEKTGVSKQTVRNLCKNHDGSKPIDGGFTPKKVDSTWILWRIHK